MKRILIIGGVFVGWAKLQHSVRTGFEGYPRVTAFLSLSVLEPGL